MTLQEAKHTPFAWPGGYPIYALLDDGAMVCHHCLTTEEAIHEGGDADGWRFEGADIYWEGPVEYCAHCNAELPSAYGEVAP